MTRCSLLSVDGGGATGAAIAGGLSWRLTKRRAAAVACGLEEAERCGLLERGDRVL